MNDLNLLLTGTAHDTRPHAAIVISGGNVTRLWTRSSYADALETLRRWYAIRRTLYAIDEAGLGGTPFTDEAYGPNPAIAMVEEIADWYSDGDTDYSVVIAPIEEDDPVELCLREEIPAYTKAFRSEVRLAILDAMSKLGEAKQKAGPIQDDL